MDINSEIQSGSYTILRIKRKRTDEPLDALVVESRVRRKKSRGGAGVFQFAQTVEQGAWKDEGRQKALEDQICRLVRGTMSGHQSTDSLTLSTTNSSQPSRQQKGEPNRRYHVVDRYLPDGQETQRRATSPPKVICANDLPPKSSPFKLYDAILADVSTPRVSDSEMENFLPMLTDYFKLHDISQPPSPKSMPPRATLPLSVSSAVDDYVWDVFYHRPATFKEWNEAASVATLTGLPPLITHPYDSDSEEEVSDEADEDSNAEEYYTNDYPNEDPSDEGSDGNDILHDSDFDDMMHDDDDLDWR